MNILGQKYEVVQDESLVQTDVDGLCLKYSRKIRIRPMKDMLDDSDDEAEKQKRYNEELVDWIANQFPKMYKAFKEHDCLE